MHSLHSTGDFFYFEGSKDSLIRRTIFLNPQGIVDNFVAALGMVPMSQNLLQHRRTELQHIIDKVASEYEALAALRKELDTSAGKMADFVSYGATSGKLRSDCSLA